MNSKITTKELVLSGLLLASGIILPMIFHMFGMVGSIVLPMHIPVLIAGFLLSPQLALLLGIITPIISGLLTGMPVMFPMAVIMAFELGTYGFISSLATRKLKLPLIPSLIMAMLSGRVIAGLTVAVLVQLFGVKLNALMFVKSAIIIGLPGIIIQLIFIPPIIYAIKVYMKKTSANV
ncbi:ECF transporter S component [Sedimentibacter sp. MB31-C6]|uniref:ECF transporter S component n=1 Tax=Sedimentibacter sp. MB31-C6 TaxID=3109366 RepID=UPI002DDD0BAB|nr:ECF transporter S component [Sedimentibacter sp. MB36-C1]WSI05539.1 ECF transporter S component [Sedimentibacter sp. MB36-C1]